MECLVTLKAIKACKNGFWRRYNSTSSTCKKEQPKKSQACLHGCLLGIWTEHRSFKSRKLSSSIRDASGGLYRAMNCNVMIQKSPRNDG
uniref:AlNc14C119G6625 protein n=1 Tax=Albugo laibachii Nc14 TaxID=890382 RepID=F0WJ94_9STRA|nr:AlNc14C119G6625 [Albugo laibachii Nc14]CCA26612.1 AlNc14C395G11316 [Albugo laibachii Nc14]|eukprot:CCA26612.1 AlNc14C395G11316 [Albugo laibachii Nc14]